MTREEEMRQLREANRNLTPEEWAAVNEAAKQVMAWKYLRRDMEDTGMVTL